MVQSTDSISNLFIQYLRVVLGGVHSGEHGEDECGRLTGATLALCNHIFRWVGQKCGESSLLDPEKGMINRGFV